MPYIYVQKRLFFLLLNSPGWLSNLITMLCHSMAAISEIGDFRTLFVFFNFLFGIARLMYP